MVLILIAQINVPLTTVGTITVQKSRPNASVICLIKSEILIIPLLPGILNESGGLGISDKSRVKKLRDTDPPEFGLL